MFSEMPLPEYRDHGFKRGSFVEYSASLPSVLGVDPITQKPIHEGDFTLLACTVDDRVLWDETHPEYQDCPF